MGAVDAAAAVVLRQNQVYSDNTVVHLIGAQAISSDFHRQGNLFLCPVDGKDPDFYGITDGYDIHRVGDVLAAELRNVNETVLLDSDVYEGAEVYYIAAAAMRSSSASPTPPAAMAESSIPIFFIIASATL